MKNPSDFMFTEDKDVFVGYLVHFPFIIGEAKTLEKLKECLLKGYAFYMVTTNENSSSSDLSVAAEAKVLYKESINMAPLVSYNKGNLLRASA